MSFSIVVSLGLCCLGCWLWPHRWLLSAVFVALLGLSLALLTRVYLVSDWFTGQGIDESVLYHLSVGLGGAGFTEYLGVIGMAFGLLLLSLVFGSALWWLLRRPSTLSSRWGLATLPLVLAAWVVNPGSQSLTAVGHHYVLSSPSGELPEAYAQPASLNPVEGVTRPKNLVLIYAESLERTYFDESVFPGLLPKLRQREKQGLNFTYIDQLPGMGWTVAGMVGSQCGVPLGRSPGWMIRTM